MTAIIRSVSLAFAVALLACNGAYAQSTKPHRVVIQVDQNDPEVMNLALNNAKNVIEYYSQQEPGRRRRGGCLRPRTAHVAR